MKKTNFPVVYKDPNKGKEGEVVPSEDMNSEEANTTYLDAVDSLRYAVEAMRFPPTVNTFKQFAFDPNNIGQCIVTEDADFEVVENKRLPASEPPSWEQVKERLRERNPEDYKRLMRGDFSEEKEAVIEFDENLKPENFWLQMPSEDVANTEKLIEAYIEIMKEGFAEMLQGVPNFSDFPENV